MLRFDVECETKLGELVAVCGSGPLGNWEVSNSLVLQPINYPRWEGEVPIETSPVSFKYVVVNREDGLEDGRLQLVRWEGDFANREADLRNKEDKKLILHHRFGDRDFAAEEIMGLMPEADAKGDGYASTPSQPPQAPSRSEAEAPTQSVEAPIPEPLTLPVGSNAPAAEDGLLSSLEVEPTFRLTRLVRSNSAKSFRDKYSLQTGVVLGEGMSGGVVVAVVRESGAEVAVKRMALNGSADEEQMKAEVQHQLVMDHPNICRLFEVYEEPDQLILVMEKLSGRDLFEHLQKNQKGHYTEKDAVDIVRQMMSAVAYCHRSGVCHRDLKLENFCMEDESEHARIKMIDFGLSSTFSSRQAMTNACGTLYYVAPEVLAGRYDEKCDMWSLGVLTYILLSGRAPFMGRDDRKTYRLIKAGNFSFPHERWSNVSTEAKNFITALLQLDPVSRLSAEDALVHPWFNFHDASSANSELPELDSKEVFDGLRNFIRGNKVKRAILRAMAPVASIEEVKRWADLFEALDEGDLGTIKVKHLAETLAQHCNSKEEAAALSAAIAESGSEDQEEISYSAFLAACLCAHHSNLDKKQLQELFDRLDPEKTGHVSAVDVGKALGDAVSVEDLLDEFPDGKLSYTDFRWLLQRPPIGCSSLAGLRQLLGTFEDIQIKSWRVDIIKAKVSSSPDMKMEAARRENAAWRNWHKHMKESEGSLSSPAHNLSLPTVTESPVSHDGSRASSRASSRERLILEDHPPATLDAVDKTSSELQKDWRIVTAEAKEGDTDAARRENLAWRKMHIRATKGSPKSPDDSEKKDAAFDLPPM